MSGITTHVLDTAQGRPAAGVAVTLAVRNGDAWTDLATGRTDTQGRAGDLLPPRAKRPGTFRLRFEVGDYFAARGVAAFFPYVDVVLTLGDEPHYHVPLLVGPFGYTTYRGS
ncbi:MAG: hydroxyisourate hydrolase [Gemmatimonadales bacterium]